MTMTAADMPHPRPRAQPSPQPTPPEGAPLVVVFEDVSQAQQAVQQLVRLGLGADDVGLLLPTAPGSGSGAGTGTPSTAAGADPGPRDVEAGSAGPVSATLASAAAADDMRAVLTGMGVAEAQARFYEREVQAGQALLVVRGGPHFERARTLARNLGGHDVETRGADLARGEGQSGDQAGAASPVAPPREVTTRWEDVRPRYEMLFGQRYGATNATWDQVEPTYRVGWELANQPDLRGRPWAEVAPAARRAWERRVPGVRWEDVEGAIGDVFADVADEAASGAEGGEDRRVWSPIGQTAQPAPWTPPEATRTGGTGTPGAPNAR